MDFNAIKTMYDNENAKGAIGMLLIVWAPGTHKPPDQYIPIYGKNFVADAEIEFQRTLQRRNNGLQVKDQLSREDFKVNGPTTNKLSLPTITYTKTAIRSA